MLTFSIIIPCYNAQHTLIETLNAIKAQSYPAWDVIVIDDGSTDGSRVLASAMAAYDHRITLVGNPGKGPSHARNHGAMDLAKGDVIAFCDADDIWSPTKLAELATAFEDLSVDAVYGQVAFFTARPRDAIATSTLPAGDLTVPMLLAENPVCTMSNLAIRRAAFAATGGFNPEIVHNEDLEWLIRLVGDGARVIGLDMLQVWYRASAGGLSADLVAMTRGRAIAVATAARYGHVPSRAADATYLRYLSRRSLRLGQGRLQPLRYALRGLIQSPVGFFNVPRRGLLTLIGALIAVVLPRPCAKALFSK
ncbi:glucosyl transferase [Loktanella sp. 3ANDIMAR09]|uniref:glycosyltransferase family 2 protein n=1 Tax=Loktanella sp. 3ANDIMAR09 TaxID=1225657 RepID=UPI0006F27058|nr:glycosyltransferase family A protein [Loktanella sp. 3ANDIMAR09]KQI67806.1 glucosyl transferase [Loktanella sp. 3ANDIMAR09]